MTEIKENLRFLQVTIRYPRNTIAELTDRMSQDHDNF
jgi:hypothetical protein